MKINGIDLTRADALEAAGIDPYGPMSQYKTVLGTNFAYCNQHLNVHRTDGSCTVDAFEKFPLDGEGVGPDLADFDAALDAARAAGFRIYREPAACTHCGQTIHQPQHTWVTVEEGDSRCPDRTPTGYGSGHEPVDNLPTDRIATI